MMNGKALPKDRWRTGRLCLLFRKHCCMKVTYSQRHVDGELAARHARRVVNQDARAQDLSPEDLLNKKASLCRQAVMV